jgi:xanthine/CO dehydrogenase XdhC/CoxF family maturation factor
MNELVKMCRDAHALRAAGEPGFIATVMHVQGSAFRQPGARLLFTTGRALCGSVSGGCLENDIVRRGPWLSEARPRLISYDHRVDEQDGEQRGSGCDGVIDVLIERLDDELPAFITQCLVREQRGVIVTVARSPLPSQVGARLFVEANGRVARSALGDGALAQELEAAARDAIERGLSAYARPSSGVEALVEVLEPPPRLFVFGAGPDAECTVRLAQSVGFNVSLCGVEPRFVVRDRWGLEEEVDFIPVASVARAIEGCARPLAVIMTHSFDSDRDALAHLLPSKASYIGVLGPARRCARLLAEVSAVSTTDSLTRTGRVHGPAGLHLGGSSPAEIALSILAEAQAVLNGTSAVPLRDRAAPIHSTISEPRAVWRQAQGL